MSAIRARRVRSRLPRPSERRSAALPAAVAPPRPAGPKRASLTAARYASAAASVLASSPRPMLASVAPPPPARPARWLLLEPPRRSHGLRFEGPHRDVAARAPRRDRAERSARPPRRRRRAPRRRRQPGRSAPRSVAHGALDGAPHRPRGSAGRRAATPSRDAPPPRTGRFGRCRVERHPPDRREEDFGPRSGRRWHEPPIAISPPDGFGARNRRRRGPGSRHPKHQCHRPGELLAVSVSRTRKEGHELEGPSTSASGRK